MSEISDNEAKITVKTDKGYQYSNSKTAGDIQEARALTERLKGQVRTYAANHKNEDPTAIEFRYQIGELLHNVAFAEGVTNYIRNQFIKQIEEMTDVDSLIGRSLGKASTDSRHPYLITCLWLYSKFDKETALSMTWSDWSEVFARPKIRDDSRVAKWISMNRKNITREQLREVLKEMTYFVDDHDLCFLDDQDVFDEMDKALTFEKIWNEGLKKYFKGDEKNMSEARRKSRKKYKEKYIKACMNSTMFAEKDNYEKLCEEAFVSIYVNV